MLYLKLSGVKLLGQSKEWFWMFLHMMETHVMGYSGYNSYFNINALIYIKINHKGILGLYEILYTCSAFFTNLKVI